MDFDEIEALVSVLTETGLTEMEVRQGGRVLRLRRAAPNAAPPPARGNGAGATQALARLSNEEMDALTAPDPETSREIVVAADLVGIFHAGREPLAVGDRVAQRQILGQIESMRLMNDCLSPVAGRIVALRVEEGQPVEYGQALFEIAEEDAL